jgi:uncharacterized membrane protein
VRAGVVLLALVPLLGGIAEFVAPAWFYEQIGTYPPRNLHYVGDVGAFSLAYGAALLAAAWRPAWRVPLLVVGAGWFALHALNHAFDTDEARSTARGVLDTVLLAVGAALYALLAWLIRTPPRRSPADG